MEVMTTKHMLIFLFCLILSSQGLLGCDVEVQVRRGTVYKALLHQHVEVKCPLQHCDRAVQVAWCKLLETNERKCQNLSNSDHIQINEHMLLNGMMESVLTFKRISAEDSGLYKCEEVYHKTVGHWINVTVTNQWDQNQEKNPENPQNGLKDENGPNEDKMKMISFAYLIIFSVILLMLPIITAIVMLTVYCFKSRTRHQPKTQEEQPSHMIPGLPTRSPPVLHQSLPAVRDVSSSVFVSPPSCSESAIGNQLLTATGAATSAATSAAPRSLVYSQINHTKSRKSIQHHASGEGTSQTNAMSVVSSESL